MKLSGTCLALGVVPLVILTCAQVTGGGSGAPSDVRAGTARLAEDVPLVGVGAVHALHPGDEHVAENLIGILEAIQPWVTGETLCPPSSMSCMQVVGHAAPLKELTAVPAGVKCSPKHLM